MSTKVETQESKTEIGWVPDGKKKRTTGKPVFKKVVVSEPLPDHVPDPPPNFSRGEQAAPSEELVIKSTPAVRSKEYTHAGYIHRAMEEKGDEAEE